MICGESSEDDLDLPTPMVDENYGLYNTISHRKSSESDNISKNIQKLKNDNENHNNFINFAKFESYDDLENGNGNGKLNLLKVIKISGKKIKF